VDEIHEQEIGRKVFGCSADYDTATDNIVRVHASMLRKRLDQYLRLKRAADYRASERKLRAGFFETEEQKTFHAETQSSRRRRRYLFGLVGQGLGVKDVLALDNAGLPHKSVGTYKAPRNARRIDSSVMPSICSRQ
jgi:hypothetical protein